jgi:hypothetical protein
MHDVMSQYDEQKTNLARLNAQTLSRQKAVISIWGVDWRFQPAKHKK